MNVHSLYLFPFHIVLHTWMLNLPSHCKIGLPFHYYLVSIYEFIYICVYICSCVCEYSHDYA